QKGYSLPLIISTPFDCTSEVVATSERHRIGTFPVVDNNGNLVGILTNTDLLHILAKLLD
ncbi:MAG: CBS domain-containing protein, partial [Chloroflexota bacterium]